MCGRYAATADPATLAAELDAVDETVELDEQLRPEERGPNYNVAPTNRVLTVVRRHDHDEQADLRTRIRRMRWGLIPSWTKPAAPGMPAKGKPLFNARADRAASTPAFGSSLAKRRCLVPMDGWYEWQVEPSAHGKAVKAPYYVTASDGSRLYLAGLWSVWRDGPAQPVLSCTILTTDAIGDLRDIHDRMPLIMPRTHWHAWLDPDHPTPEGLLAGVEPEVLAGLELRRVGAAVNSVKNNDPSLLRPAEDVKPAQVGLFDLA